MRYAITGGVGFIGINFADALLNAGHEVVLLDNLSRAGTRTNLDWIRSKHGPRAKFVPLDIRTDRELLATVMDSVDVVHHLAAQVAVTTSIVAPRTDFDVNAAGTFNVLEAVRLSRRRPILLYASTNKVYGGMDDVKIQDLGNRYSYVDYPEGIPETRGLDFHSPYGCSKGSADQYVRDYARTYGMRCVVMRQSCIYGPHQFGVEDQGWVAWFAIAGFLDKPVTIYGNGKQVRDLLHVDDLFNAWESALKRIDKVSGEIYNLGGGPRHTASLKEMLALLERQLKKKFTVTFAGPRVGDQPIFVCDIGKAKRELAWEPKVDVETGVSRLVDWVRQNGDIFTAFHAPKAA